MGLVGGRVVEEELARRALDLEAFDASRWNGSLRGDVGSRWSDVPRTWPRR
jgi:hypothetical protein